MEAALHSSVVSGSFLMGKKVDGGPWPCQYVCGGWRWRDKGGGWEDVLGYGFRMYLVLYGGKE